MSDRTSAVAAWAGWVVGGAGGITLVGKSAALAKYGRPFRSVVYFLKMRFWKSASARTARSGLAPRATRRPTKLYAQFGATASYAELVTYYRTQLRERGDEVFEQPPTHMFQVGRFRDETMAFPPGVTVKDWTWGGSQGYPNPKLGAQPARYPTVIMIVPAPPAAPVAR